MPESSPRVSIATAATREEAVARALDLIRDDILEKVRGRVMIKPNFLSSTDPLASTTADAVGPILSFLRDSSAESVIIAEGGSRSTSQALDTFGYRPLLKEFDIKAVDLNRVQHPLSFGAVTALSGGEQDIQYADIRALADTVISVPVAKTHDCAMVTLSVKNMMGCIRRVHRPRMHGIVVGNMVSRIAERIWNAIERRTLVIKSFSGIVFTVVNRLRSRGADRRSGLKPGIVRQSGAMAENLARMGTVLMPDITVIDAFEAMEGDGPGSSGTPVDMRVAVAGTDPVACDAVMARLMGFDPMNVGHLHLLHERGLGVADTNIIETVGEKPEAVARAFKPHYNLPEQLRWRSCFRIVNETGAHDYVDAVTIQACTAIDPD